MEVEAVTDCLILHSLLQVSDPAIECCDQIEATQIQKLILENKQLVAGVNNKKACFAASISVIC